MQNLVIVICCRDVEAVFIKGKNDLSTNHVVIVFSMKLERICKQKGFLKSIMVEANIFLELCGTLFLIIINTERAKEKIQFLTVSSMFGQRK